MSRESRKARRELRQAEVDRWDEMNREADRQVAEHALAHPARKLTPSEIGWDIGPIPGLIGHVVESVQHSKTVRAEEDEMRRLQLEYLRDRKDQS